MNETMMSPILTLTPSHGCAAPTITRSGNKFVFNGSFINEGDMSMIQVWMGEQTADLENAEVVLDLLQAEACISRNMRVLIFTVACLLQDAFEVRFLLAQSDDTVLAWQMALVNAIRTGGAQDNRLHIETRPAKACAA